MGIINFLSPTNASVSFSYTSNGNNPYPEITGVPNNVIDGNVATQYSFYARRAKSISTTLNLTITLNKIFYITQITKNIFFFCGFPYDEQMYYTDSNNIEHLVYNWYGDYLSHPQIATFDINNNVKSIRFYYFGGYGTSSNSLIQSRMIANELYAYGPDIPTSGLSFYKDKTFQIGRDTDSVSPLYLNNQRIAIGSTTHALATPFRFYWDGETYAILKAQGT